ncbi:oxidoreductase [Streptomyces sp. URMC 127]|uniref:oxidoreductase n=1 Tax=Streptomyces sp. URMC 127 TaxID=3423402 RepID=UPI003F1BFD45
MTAQKITAERAAETTTTTAATTTAATSTAPTTTTTAAPAAGTWQLGDLTVNRIGFGAMRLPQTGEALIADAVPRDRDTAIRVLRRAVELGVNHIDTAAFYFSPLRSANELINRALAPYPEDLVITTKVGPRRNPSGEWLPHATSQQLRGQVEENLRQLGRDHLDVVNLRVLGTGSIAERFGALAELRDAGLIRHLGISNVTPDHLTEARAIAPVVCVQNMYGVGVRPDQDAFVRSCGEQGIAFVPFYAVAASGRETGASGTEHPEVLAVAGAHGASPAQVRIAWTLHRGSHVLAIPGTGDPDHLASNVAAGELRLSEDDLAVLDSLHQRGV